MGIAWLLFRFQSYLILYRRTIKYQVEDITEGLIVIQLIRAIAEG